jgi:localization factor PodJL
MAYGYSRGARGYEPDPRDVIEDAAREAGMSVQQWLDRALADDSGEAARRGNRSTRRSGRDRFEESPLEAAARRIARRGPRDGSGYSDDRVERILQDAMDTIRANEERTASALETLERRIEDRGAIPERTVDNRIDNRVLSLIDNIERGMNTRSPPPSNERAAAPADPDLIGALEQKISNVVDLIEQRSRQPAPPVAEPPQGQRRDLRSGAAAPDAQTRARSAEIKQVERQLALLGSRMDALMRQSADRGQPGQDVMSGQLTRLQQDIARLARPEQPSSSQDILLAIRTLGHKLAQLEQSPVAGAQFERLMAEIAAMRAGLHGERSGGAQDFSALERHFESLENRLEVITDKVMTMRVSGVRDLRGQKSVEKAIDELKHLVQTSAKPADDSRVIDAVQALERRLDAMERAPQAATESIDRFETLEQKLDALRQTPAEIASRLDHLQSIEHKLDAMQQAPQDIAARLDHLQSLMAERPAPVAAAMSANTEMLLGNLAARIETLQHSPSDDQAFERLHQDIQALSRKLEATPAAQQAPAMADVSGLERSISDLFRQLDGLKSDIGTATEHAVRRAATDVLSKAPVQTGASGSLAENVQVQRTLSDIHVAQQEAERRTSETLGAVHDTLQKVVGRLVDMEKDMKRRDDMPAPVLPPSFATIAAQTVRPALQPLQSPPPPAAAPTAPDSYAEPDIWAAEPEPAHAYPAPSAAREMPFAPPSPVPLSGPGPMPLKPIMANPLPPLGAPQTAAMESRPMMAEPPRLELSRPEPPLQTSASHDTVASLRAQRMGVSAPVAAEEPVNKSAFASAFAAARGAVAGIKLSKGKSKDLPGPVAADIQPPLHDAAQQAQPDTASTLNDSLDLPLEPGSGRPEQGRNQKPDSVAGHDPKSNFLAAARRAAQTAADQSAEALAPAASKGKAASGRAGFSTKTSLSKKHVLLLGLAALIVAVGATVQFTREPEATQPRVEAPPARKTTVLERAVDRLAQVSTGTPPVVQPRQILPPVNEPLPPQITAAKPDDRILSQPPRQAQGEAAFLPSDPATVGALGQEAGKGTALSLNPPKSTTATANDPLFRFEGIREAERLKAAARNGDPAAFIELGTRYLEGKGAPRDPKAAALWFERAADFGSAPAQYRLGALYREGRGVERNTRMALKYFQTASDAGNARAMHNTAVLLAEGVNGSPDYAGASELFKKASELGIRDSQYNLAILYARGLGVSQDLMASYAWFAAAAANGDEDAGKKRDEVGARLSGEKLQQAKAAAAAWKPKTPDPAANEVNVPAGGWDAATATPPPPAGQKPKPNRT